MWADSLPTRIAESLRKAELDPAECYRVRDLHFTRGDDLRFYFTEGYLIFGKPVAGRRISAVFATDTEGGDGELLVLPPTKGERVSLAAFTQSPNLSEHFHSALLLFTDDSADALLQAIQSRGEPRKSPERGVLLAAEWNSVLSHLSTSFSVRLVHHLLAQQPPSGGLFYAGIQGKKLGNFDAFFDPELHDQIYLGQLKVMENRAYYDTWTSFQARPYRTGARKPDPFDCSLSNFRIDAALDPELRLRVTTKVTAAIHRGPLKALPFEITGGMRVTEVRVNGQIAELFTRESLRANAIRSNDTVLFLVVPEQPLQSGAYEIEFHHEGSVVRPAGRNVYYVGARSNWYPRSGTDFAQFDLRFTYPSHLQIVFPGELKEDRTEGEQRVTRRVTSAPIRLAGFNLGQYESAKCARGPLSVEVFANKQVETSLARPPTPVLVQPPPMPFPPRNSGPRATVLAMPAPPPDPTARLEAMAQEIAASYEFLAAHLGPPALPNLMVSPIPGAFGQGFPGLVYLSTLSYLNPNDRPPQVRDAQHHLFFSDILQAHEVAHQWWGNLVTSASPQDDWLMESLANYSALLLLEKKKGPKALLSVLEQYKKELLATKEDGGTVESTGPLRLGTRLSSSQSRGAWQQIIYGKGTWTMHMLRRRLGEAAFLKLLGDVCRRFRYQQISARQFQEMAAVYLPKGAADPRLEGFFEHWVDGTGIPTLAMTSSIRGKAPALKLTVTVTQAGVQEDVSIQVPVEVQIARGRVQTHWVTTGPEPVIFTLPLRAAPLKATLDPDGSVLAVKK